MDGRPLRTDARNGQLSAEQLLDLLEQHQRTIWRLEATVQRLTERLAR
jgi:hypothetical protein